ncbi:SIR2 family protein [Elizabethkingia anophelis]|uniref:SIR2 family protein n=2 Tax=Elizabethkingia anophelis TaxID=1117645 RepID=UPI0013667611|nr:SIR2 family protein [Elizabethkingia anophelis]MCL1034155.1 SIR2 family protein [Elizabethkingia anophelis]MCW2462565.1 ribosomal protein S8 [Elizabethkingia anophelis]MCW2466250.1 ribosomal protein S8 [Elizabethkingia anophelis]MCW2469934.1 ribosomal protein S8 [Elizabethkingia anophelis]MDV4015226.1 hypothetical protein [Elizabethkingia anophelis]
MNKRFLADIQIIKNAINTNKLVIFAGAGISIDADVPSWATLISEITNDLDLPNNENDFLKIAQIYFNDRQEKEYIEKIRNTLGHKKLRYNEIHEELFELNPEHILTTNFEDLLEQVIIKNSLPFSVIKEDKDLPYSNNTKLLVKIHGDLDSGNIVFKEDDYLSYSQNHPLLDSFIKSIFASKVVLFIGYSFNDYNLKQVVQYVRDILGKNFQNAYLLSVEQEVHQSHRQYLKNKGINVINYFDSNYSITKENNAHTPSNYIDNFLRNDNIYGAKNNFLKEIRSLSEKGQLLLNFLRFIRHYDKLKVSINSDNVIDQIYNSFIRFDEIKCLPQYFINQLHPFKSTLQYDNLVENTTLLLRNIYISNLFFENIDINNSEIVLKNINESYKKKIEYIIRKLNNALIYSVAKKEDKAGYFGHKDYSNERKNINFFSKNECSCSKCKFNKYEFRESLNEINNYSITDTSDIIDDMQKAFLNYKFGNFFQSFKMFEEIASKAWITQKFITYYIAHTNMKSLRNLLDYDFQIEEAKRDIALEKINVIDLDKLIFQIPNKSDTEYALLKIIRDDEVLLKVKSKVEKYYEEILKTYKLFKDKYSISTGPNYPMLIYLELYKLLTFYNENYIINDVFSDFTNIINKGVEALMISYSTSNRCMGKINEFDIDFFELVIPYIDTNKFIKVLNENNIEEIKFKKDNLGKILRYANNFFSSYFEKSLMFGIESKSEIIEIQLQKKIFEEKTKKIFNNIIVFLSLIELKRDQFDSVKENLFKYLSHEKKMRFTSISRLKYLLVKNSSYITIDNCKKLLEISYKGDNEGVLEIVGEICYNNNYEIIDKIEYANKLFYDLEYGNENSDNIIYLWLISNDEIKAHYFQKLINKLQNNFNFNLFELAIYYKVIDNNILFENFLIYINSINLNNNPEDNGYIIEEGEPKLLDFNFYNAILLLYRLEVKSDDKRLKKLKNLYEYMKFCIYREKYNFSQFKIEWLYLFEHETFFNEFRKIKPLKKIIEASLKENYDKELALIYTQYFL